MASNVTASRTEARNAYLLLLVMPLFFSSNIVIARGIGDAVPPFTLALLRWALAVAILLPFAWSPLIRHRPVLKSSWRRILLLGFLGMWICGALVYIALAATTATNGTLIYTTSPVIVLLIETVVLRKPLSPLRLAGVVLALAGVAVIVLKGDVGALLGLRFNPGDLGIAAAATAWAVYSVVLRDRSLATMPTLSLFAAIAMAGVVTLLPFSLWEAWHGPVLPATLPVWTAVLALALFSAVGAFSLYQYGVKVVGPAITSCFLYLLPLYGVGMSVLFLGESLHAYHFAGMALVLVGLVAATAPTDIAAALAARFRPAPSGEPPHRGPSSPP
ncbi:DMT family transporter [Phreatobacter sp. AB_2022a]|uniref:DMT family transporter n=1 Tax=Phreatobacter sp. AB_2022a TaxID=3003134 RepID=UPI0022875E0B|nr:DMT family transporter [Phreatobacter sp. AB_2022a]MCZ0734967.1 DMT family transporter [Phreatobacter sp. AB_2022a]